MPRCSCAGNSCGCLIQGGDGVSISGTGNNSAPYTISLTTQYQQINHAVAGPLDLTPIRSGTLLEVALGANVTDIQFAGGLGTSYEVLFRQNVSGGATVAWPSIIEWPGGADPVLSTTLYWAELISFRKLAGSWLGVVLGAAIR